MLVFIGRYPQRGRSTSVILSQTHCPTPILFSRACESGSYLGQVDGKSRALAELPFDINRPSVEVNELLGDAESQARGGFSCGGSGGEAFEAAKQISLVVFGPSCPPPRTIDPPMTTRPLYRKSFASPRFPCFFFSAKGFSFGYNANSLAEARGRCIVTGEGYEYG